MIEYLQTNDDKYRDALIALYIGCFSSGLSAQYIDEDQLSDYIDFILNKGYEVLAIENELGEIVLSAARAECLPAAPARCESARRSQSCCAWRVHVGRCTSVW